MSWKKGRRTTDTGTRDSVKDKVVGRAEDGDEGCERVEETDEEADGATGAWHADAAEEREVQATTTVGGRERERANRKTDHEAVTEVQRGHGGYIQLVVSDYGMTYTRKCSLTILVAELVLRPHARLPLLAVHSVHKAKAAREIAQFTRYSRVTQQTRRHARPQREEDEREEVAHGHRAAACLVDERARSARCNLTDTLLGLVGDAVTGDAETVDVYQEEDRSGDVDEAVEPVDVFHEGAVAEEEGLDLGLEEDAQTLLDSDEVQGMLTGDVDGVLLQCDRGDRAAKLVDL